MIEHIDSVFLRREERLLKIAKGWGRRDTAVMKQEAVDQGSENLVLPLFVG